MGIIYYHIEAKYTPQRDTKWYLKKYTATILFLLIESSCAYIFGLTSWNVRLRYWWNQKCISKLITRENSLGLLIACIMVSCYVNVRSFNQLVWSHLMIKVWTQSSSSDIYLTRELNIYFLHAWQTQVSPGSFVTALVCIDFRYHWHC